MTAALELLERTDIVPVVYELEDQVGGIARTIERRGNRIDIGGHRFFSKSDRVMDWWAAIMPTQGNPGGVRDLTVSYHNRARQVHLDPAGPDPERTDLVMLVRDRLSRILYRRRFFDYPVSLNATTVRNLGPWRMARIGLSYLWARARPVRPERTLEDFFVNRFGRQLYLTFFRDYTEKVWGVPCTRITAEWGAQRIKGLSISKALAHALRGLIRRGSVGVRQKDVETSLIERFLYPKLGPGQMWEEVARRVRAGGGQVLLRHRVSGLETYRDRIVAARVENLETGEVTRVNADHFFSTAPIRELVAGLDAPVPEPVRRVAAGLMYRDFMTVGLLLDRLEIRHPATGGLIPDNWIYVQEPDVRIGRLQIFNNWSQYLVRDPSTVWIGLEYFVNEGEELWRMPDDRVAAFAIEELARIGIADPRRVLDHTVLRVPKAYPAYFGTYDRFEIVRDYLDSFENLFLIGRNGMHRYNNQDHSMLTAMAAVDNLVRGRTDKANIWAVNTEESYHEQVHREPARRPEPVAI